MIFSYILSHMNIITSNHRYVLVYDMALNFDYNQEALLVRGATPLMDLSCRDA